MSMSLGQHPSISVRTPPSHLLQNWSQIIPTRRSRNNTSKLNQFSHLGHHHHRHRRPQPWLCNAAENDNNPPDVRENTPPNNPHEEGPQDQEPFWSTTQIITRLRKYGIAGVLSYGLLNTAYYLIAFLLVWFYIAPVPGKMGYWAAVDRFVKIMAIVWAGSQVTKIVRAGGALALAPFVDRGLSWFTVKFEFESQGKAFMAIVGCCFGLAALLFFVLTLLWA
ncbi:uncharacterized protein LOC131298861 [Rhododendron vialii]|uniref:uncharacterized protein LOC131298861 n=1 Tax=Rhododendron vialii TaxID=182163 RepID=UPI00265FCF94|nr:uncharacterized protein LOC131298861 [Rhododendron vialii]